MAKRQYKCIFSMYSVQETTIQHGDKSTTVSEKGPYVSAEQVLHFHEVMLHGQHGPLSSARQWASSLQPPLFFRWYQFFRRTTQNPLQVKDTIYRDQLRLLKILVSFLLVSPIPLSLLYNLSADQLNIPLPLTTVPEPGLKFLEDDVNFDGIRTTDLFLHF